MKPAFIGQQHRTVILQECDDNMRKLEIRPGVLMAYEDHWFGEPWTIPETVVMVHGNSESSRRAGGRVALAKRG